MKRYASTFVLVAFVLGTSSGALAAGPNVCAWQVVDSPNKNNSMNANNALNGAYAISNTDAWAAGYYTNANGPHSLLEHWNGTEWKLVAAPVPAGVDDQLIAMGGTSSADVWAVGTYFNPTDNRSETLIDHFDGVSWSVVPSPNLGTGFSELRAVSASTAGNAWAVGQYFDPSSNEEQNLAEHWNGRKWLLVPGINLGHTFNAFTAVAAFGPANVYAVDDANNLTDGSNNFTPQIEHFDGVWNLQPTPEMGFKGSPLNALAPITKTDIWALGDWFDGTKFQTLAENWDGSVWTIVPSPNHRGPGGSDDYTELLGAAGTAPADVIGVGAYFNGTFQTYTMVWNGTKWKTLASPNVGTGTNILEAAAGAVNTANFWAVGYHANSVGAQRTLILQLHC